jgi:hypothetical protein
MSLPGVLSEPLKETDGTQSPQSPGLLQDLAEKFLGLRISNTEDTASVLEDLTASITSKDSKKSKDGEGNENAEDLSDWEDFDNILPGNPARHWEHLTTDEEAQDLKGWTLEADRHLCLLWFFTPYSFCTIASLLNYSATTPPLPRRIHGRQAKKRLIKLSADKTYDRAFVYHDIKRLAATAEAADWSSAVQEADHAFAAAWSRMRHDIDTAKLRGEESRFTAGGKEVRGGYDRLTDAQLARMRRRRKWGVKERKKLEGAGKWGGLGVVGICRPEVVESGYETDASIERGEGGRGLKGAARKGWLW